MYTRTVEPNTLALLKKIMSHHKLSSLVLVGGTSLALQLGHRESIDLDLFGKFSVEAGELKSIFESIGKLDIIHLDSNNAINSCSIDGIKIDIVNYSYDLIKPIVVEDGIRMASFEDIAAMKLSAIGSRGTKKDFYDFYFLLQMFSIYEIVSFFKEKYDISDVMHYILGLGYFEDAERDLDPIMFEPLPWEKVKAKITKEIQALDFMKL
jgi:Nucleotidyl transferase AbiEii toxin, Type IV TA system